MASTNLIGDITAVITTGPTSLTTAKAIAATGPVMDYPGNCRLVLLKFEEAVTLLARVITDTDSTDSVNLALLQGVQALLKGTASPATTPVADLMTVYTSNVTSPVAATVAKAIAAAGPILDYPGCVSLVRRYLQEARYLLGQIVNATDSGDGSLTTLNSLYNTLV